MNTFKFTNKARKDFTKLPLKGQERIKTKLTQLKIHNNLGSILKPLDNLDPATHRLRIGSIRILLQANLKKDSDSKIIILKIGHRKDIYK